MNRLTLRLVCRNSDGKIQQIYEQSNPANQHSLTLMLRRYPFKQAVADTLLSGGTATFEPVARSMPAASTTTRVK